MVLSSEKERAQQQIESVCNLFYLCTGIPIWYESGDYTYSSEHKPPEEPSEAYLHSAIQECLRWARANSAYLAPVSYTMPKGEIMLCYIITIKPLGAFFCGPMACESFEYWERFSQVEKNDGDMYRYWRSLPQIELQRIPAIQYILELLVKDSGSHLSRGISLPSAGLDQIAPLRLTKKEVTPHHSMPRQENLIRNALETGTIDHGLIASRIIKPLAKNDMLRSEKNRYIVNLIINSRTAISLGVNSDIAFSYSDELLPLVEECQSVEDVRILSIKAFRVYYNLVQETRQGLVFSSSVNDLMEYVQKHYSESLNLKELTRLLGYNYKYISSVFASEVKETFTAYLNRVRIQKAMQLLRNPELTVTEIAQFVGYSQAGYFARRFREIAGSSPREYRDKL